MTYSFDDGDRGVLTVYCKHCPWTFDNLLDYEGHMRRNHAGKPCTECQHPLDSAEHSIFGTMTDGRFIERPPTFHGYLEPRS